MSQPSGADARQVLCLLLKGKEESAFPAMMAAYGRLFRWYFRKTGMPEWEAEDRAVELIEDIILAKIAAYQGDGAGFHGWVVTIMRNAAIDWRRRRHLQTEPINGDFVLAEKSGIEDCNILPIPERIEAVRAALAQLSEADGKIVYLHLENSCGFKEIAAALDMAEGTARVRYHRALQRLKKLLGDGLRSESRYATEERYDRSNPISTD